MLKESTCIKENGIYIWEHILYKQKFKIGTFIILIHMHSIMSPLLTWNDFMHCGEFQNFRIKGSVCPLNHNRLGLMTKFLLHVFAIE